LTNSFELYEVLFVIALTFIYFLTYGQEKNDSIKYKYCDMVALQKIAGKVDMLNFMNAKNWSLFTIYPDPSAHSIQYVLRKPLK
jgi:hypothetical protein